MNVLVSVERRLLADLARSYEKSQTIDDTLMKGLVHFYGYDIVQHAIDLLKHRQRLVLYRTADGRRLYHFGAQKNQVSVYTLLTSNFCTCSFYREHILDRDDFFACPHNLAIKLHDQIFSSSETIDIETFDVSNEYLIDRMTRLFEQSCDLN